MTVKCKLSKNQKILRNVLFTYVCFYEKYI